MSGVMVQIGITQTGQRRVRRATSLLKPAWATTRPLRLVHRDSRAKLFLDSHTTFGLMEPRKITARGLLPETLVLLWVLQVQRWSSM